ncbi:hypothetical protein TSUD_213650 [Trifolium subterraneum]|uniref:Uncharacterized protein n=1 Tax=Trifolium subterraneum TaxID=3900 RepID=A0A2Z6MZB4_TRISU|nr:hypothetical protein TSUD_213650 [Trifolium subterraneum]
MERQEDEAPKGEIGVCYDPSYYDQCIVLTMRLGVCEDLHLVLVGRPVNCKSERGHLQVVILLTIACFNYVSA